MLESVKTLARRAKRRLKGPQAPARVVFDAAYYLRRNPDVAASGVDPFSHFEAIGWAEGRNPCPLFDVRFYFEQNPDVAQAGINPLLHYIARGASEKRRFSPLFDTNWYLANNLDLSRSEANPLVHFILYGADEGREANPLFDSAWYVAQHPETAREATSALAHYAEHGLARRLSPHPLLHAAWYLEKYPDVADAGLDPLAHYLMRGAEEHRQPHPLFDAPWYLAGNPDVAAAGLNPLLHYLERGAAEGRSPNRLFDPAFYASQCPDASNVLVHYVTRGARDGAQPHPLFDGAWYLEHYRDVAEAGLNPLAHYLDRGHLELRQPHPLFDTEWYLRTNPDVASAGVNPVLHYLETGWREGRNPSARFDTAAYVAQHPELRTQDLCPLIHFVRAGGCSGEPTQHRASAPSSSDSEEETSSEESERAAIAPFFDADFYLKTYPDVADAAIDPLTHYHQTGWREGRLPSARFNPAAYFRRHPDAKAAGVCPLVHYVRSGAAAEGDVDLLAAEREIVEPFFDHRFYAETNPDLQGEQDLLAHFLDRGWKEYRDPCQSFSIEYYLSAHSDVRRAGTNPFVHYHAVGMLEGRAVRRSSIRRGDKSAPAVPRLAVVAMVKNEIDIIDSFAAHVLALFDQVVIVDHGSSDGTREYLRALCEKHGELAVYDLVEPGYIQSMTMNFMIQHSPELKDADWIFLLDADEFVPFDSRSALHAALARLRRVPVIEMHWRNVAPLRYWEAEVDLGASPDVIWPARPSAHKKIAFQPARLPSRRVFVAQGNHALLEYEGGEPLIAVPAGFDLVHLPIRSAAQLRLKLGQGVNAYQHLGQARRKDLGRHWFAISEAVEGKSLTADLLNGVVMTYGEDAPITPAPLERLTTDGATVRPLRVALKKLDLPAPARNRQCAEAFSSASSHGPPPRRLELRNGREIHGVRDPVVYKRLPPAECGAETAADDLRFIADFVRPSYWEYTHLTPSAWTGHLPFLFCLVVLLRPRRFAELGAHYGASFFAFCQAAKRAGLSAQAVAIDLWEGDEHTGAYDDSVFDQFRWLLRDHEDVGEYLRMSFADAAPLFEDGSIDLLHIDGLHTYEAVQDDFSTWRAKLSDCGVVLFHDINVHERGFGVWRIWKQLKRQYPSLELRHSHGLGLIYVGRPGASQVERLIRLANESEAVGDMLQQHFEEIGQKSTELHIKRHDLASREAQLQGAALAAERLTRLTQELTVTRRERDDLLRLVRERLMRS